MAGKIGNASPDDDAACSVLIPYMAGKIGNFGDGELQLELNVLIPYMAGKIGNTMVSAIRTITAMS